MKQKYIFYAQTCWIVLTGGFMLSLAKILFTSAWVWIPMFLLMWIVAAWIGIAQLSLIDKEARIAAKYGIKIENMPKYRAVFDALVRREMAGEDFSGIPYGITDLSEWMRYCLMVIDQTKKEPAKNNHHTCTSTWRTMMISTAELQIRYINDESI